MTITELAILRLTEPQTWNSEPIASFFSLLSQQQGSVSGYPLLFLHHPSSADVSFLEAHSRDIVLISGWRDLRAHEVWIASEANQKLLHAATEGKLLSVRDFMHLDVPFPALLQKLQGSGTVLYERLPAKELLPVGEGWEDGLEWEIQAKTIDEGREKVYRFAGLPAGSTVPAVLVSDKDRLWLELISISGRG